MHIQLFRERSSQKKNLRWCCFVHTTSPKGIVGNFQVALPGPQDFKEIWVNVTVSTRHRLFKMDLFTYLTYCLWLITGYPDFLSSLSLALLSCFFKHMTFLATAVYDMVVNGHNALKIVYFSSFQGRKISKRQLWPDRLSVQFANQLGFDGT